MWETTNPHPQVLYQGAAFSRAAARFSGRQTLAPVARLGGITHPPTTQSPLQRAKDQPPGAPHLAAAAERCGKPRTPTHKSCIRARLSAAPQTPRNERASAPARFFSGRKGRRSPHQRASDASPSRKTGDDALPPHQSPLQRAKDQTPVAPSFRSPQRPKGWENHEPPPNPVILSTKIRLSS
jgi:hypothetical protein